MLKGYAEEGRSHSALGPGASHKAALNCQLGPRSAVLVAALELAMEVERRSGVAAVTLLEVRDLHGTRTCTIEVMVRLLSCIATRLPVTGCFTACSLNWALRPAPASLLRSHGEGK